MLLAHSKALFHFHFSLGSRVIQTGGAKLKSQSYDVYGKTIQYPRWPLASHSMEQLRLREHVEEMYCIEEAFTMGMWDLGIVPRHCKSNPGCVVGLLLSAQ